MFAPLLLALGAILFLAYDLQHPTRLEEIDCQVLLTGKGVQAYRQQNAPILINQGAPPQFDIALSCPHTLIVNDKSLFMGYGAIQTGDHATLRHRQFRLWPDIWRVSIQHINAS